MNEKEKMQKGLLYDPSSDRKLYAERTKCKNLCHKYNRIYPEMVGHKRDMAVRILGKTKNLFYIESPFFCDYGYNIEIGENFYSNHNLIILDADKVIIGDNVLIGPNCAIYTSTHPFNSELREKGVIYTKPVSIGNNVWICGNVTILPGVAIGDNSVIGAGSVVSKNVPANVLAAGTPCKILKYLN